MEKSRLLEGNEKELHKPDFDASLVSELQTVELFLYLHCEACPDQLRRTILKMKDVRTVETEFSTNKVTLTGTMGADRIIDYIYRCTKKQAKIIRKTEDNKEEEKDADEELYVIERIPNPQLFSDENPNACSIL